MTLPDPAELCSDLDHAEAFAAEAHRTSDRDPEYASAQALTSIAYSLLVLARRVDRQDNA
jgi:hypothetical protein